MLCGPFSMLFSSLLLFSTIFQLACPALADPLACDGDKKLDESLFTLKEINNDHLSKLASIFRNDGKNVSIAEVLASSNRDMTAKPGSAAKELWAWNDGDMATGKWYPQGITSSGDALQVGTWEGQEVWLVSWYQKTDGKNVRISFVDRATHKYRHVMLVEPSADDNFTSVPIHAGGIAWYGNALYVVDTSNGLRVFDLSNIWEVETGDGIGKKSGGGYSAANYKYVIPQLRTYKWQPSSHFSHSWVSLDRSTTPDSLLIGEYSTTDVDTPIRVVRYALDYTTRKLRTTNSIATANFAYCVDILRMQGGFSLNGKYYFGRSNGESTPGDMWTWKPGEQANLKDWWFLPGNEDLSYNPSKNEYYTVTEHPGTRFIAAYNDGF